MKVKLVGYRPVQKEYPGIRCYVCEDENKRFNMYRNFNESGDIVTECIESRNACLRRYLKKGEVFAEEITIGLEDRSNFCSVSWKDGIAVEGCTLVGKKLSVYWDYLDKDNLIFLNAQEKKYLNVPEKTTNTTVEMAKKDMFEIEAHANMEKVKLSAVAKKVPQRMGTLLDFAVGMKTFWKDQFCR